LAGATTAAGRPALCIGAANPVCAGLEPFSANGQTWSTAIIFTCKENSLAFPQYQLIAVRLLQIARSADKAEIISTDLCQPPPLSAVDSAAAENFLDHMLGLYPLFGVNAFDE
jgi:hypothetical protein